MPIPKEHGENFQHLIQQVFEQEVYKLTPKFRHLSETEMIGVTRKVCLMECTMNGKPTTALCTIRMGNDGVDMDMTYVTPLFISVTDDMDLRDMDGTPVQRFNPPDKKRKEERKKGTKDARTHSPGPQE